MEKQVQILGALQLAIEPSIIAGRIQHYKLYLLNNCNRVLNFTYNFKQNELSQFKLSKSIETGTPFLLSSFEWNQLNGQIILEFEISDPHTEVHILSKSIEIKPKSLSRDPIQLPWDLNPGYLILIHKFKEVRSEPKVNLETLDVEGLRKSMLGGETHKITRRKARVTDSERILDLHANTFLDRLEHLSNAEILNLQMERFQQELDQAIQDGIPKFVVIHGIGKGKLRDSIFKMLQGYPHVKSFNNSHDNRYGFGATEIRLGN